jgi:hypothetical protein
MTTTFQKMAKSPANKGLTLEQIAVLAHMEDNNMGTMYIANDWRWPSDFRAVPAWAEQACRERGITVG